MTSTVDPATVDTTPYVHRLAAFTEDPRGGNPAGVVVTETPLDAAEMQHIATEVGYSETAFLTNPSPDRREWHVRYFAPSTEVPFCGHATVAAGVLLGTQVGTGVFRLRTAAGLVPVAVSVDGARITATLTSVAPHVEPVPPPLLEDVLTACRYRPSQLDRDYPPSIAFAGARHLVLVLRTREALAALEYDVEALRRALLAAGLTTVAFLWPAPDGRWHARNPFPVGGVVEDPATGAAAAAFGAYLRSLGRLSAGDRFEILQGEELGRPSRLEVHVPGEDGGIEVTGSAVPIV